MSVKAALGSLARTTIRLAGWRLCGGKPEVERFVIIGVPHTTNWDGVLMLLTSLALEMPVRWLGKDSLFKDPFGHFMRACGGIAVDRSGAKDTVQAIADSLHESSRFALVLAPEGSRSRRDYWRSGFFHIAERAGVPIVFGYLDYGRREVGLGPAVDTAIGIEGVMELAREFYADKDGLYPENKGPIQLIDDVVADH